MKHEPRLPKRSHFLDPTVVPRNAQHNELNNMKASLGKVKVAPSFKRCPVATNATSAVACIFLLLLRRGSSFTTIAPAQNSNTFPFFHQLQYKISTSCSSDAEPVRESVDVAKHENDESGHSFDRDEQEFDLVESRCGSRLLGSMESFMLPRPIGPHTSSESKSLHHSKYSSAPQFGNSWHRPPMNHVAAFVLSSTPSTRALRAALLEAIRSHPLLRSRVIGDGYPRRWLDPIRRMVRWNGDSREDGWIEENPMRLVVFPWLRGDDGRAGCWDEARQLRVVHVPGSTRQDLEASWKAAFERDLDSESVVAVDKSSSGTKDSDSERDLGCGGWLWKLEVHRFSSDSSPTATANDCNLPGMPCALVLTLNHAISDQGSVNLVMDQILADVAEMEDKAKRSKDDDGYNEEENRVENPAIVQEMPPCLEDSVLGNFQDEPSALRSRKGKATTRLTILDALASPFSSSARQLISYARERLQNDIKFLPTLCPSHKAGVIDLLDAASILLLGTPLGRMQDITHQRSNVEYRTLPPRTTLGLVKRSKARRVPISMTLAAAVAATCADFFGGGAYHGHSCRKRTYKVLQSLDTRRFPGATETGDTLSCQAGGMDLMLEARENLGRSIRQRTRSAGEDECIEEFWNIAKQSYNQTSSFLKGGGSVESLRLFDLGMQLCDIGRLVEAYARSSVAKGRAWSAGITNLGEYERQKSARREIEAGAGHLMATHGDYRLEEVYFATSHARVGATFPVGCITVDGRMCISINPPWPLVGEKESGDFADAFVELLTVVASEEDGDVVRPS